MGLADTTPLLSKGNGQTSPFEPPSLDEEVAFALERD